MLKVNANCMSVVVLQYIMVFKSFLALFDLGRVVF